MFIKCQTLCLVYGKIKPQGCPAVKFGGIMKRDGLSAVLPLSEAAIKQIDKWMPECYSGDDYPREGCTIVLTVSNDRVVFSSYAPNGKPLEGGPSVPRDRIGGFVDDWLSGIKSRRHLANWRPDQPLPGKSD